METFKATYTIQANHSVNKCDCARQVALINANVSIDSSGNFNKLPQAIPHIPEFFLGSSIGTLALLSQCRS